MAKKVRTPPPPRRVQAPQRRETRRSAGAQRSPWLYAGGGALVAAAIAAAVLGIVLTRGGDGGAKTKTTATNYNALPGIRKTKAPWPPEYRFLADRLPPLGLSTLSSEGAATHIHAHLDVFVNRKRVTVPPQIGINPGANYITELHTHDNQGVVHIESPKASDEFTVGQFFAEWAVHLDPDSIGGYKGMRWYLDGKLQAGNPENLIFKSHQEIAFVVGKALAKIPSTYKFPRGE